MLSQLKRHPDIRAALPEFPLGKRARIDLLALFPEELHGFEVKSAHDRLKRIHRQARAYSRYCSRLTLVIHPKHAAEVVKKIPACWGLVLATGSGKDIQFQELRPTQPNELLCHSAVLGLLWKAELCAVLREVNYPKGVSTLSHARLVSTLQRYLDPETIVPVVALLLAKRQFDYPRRQGFCA